MATHGYYCARGLRHSPDTMMKFSTTTEIAAPAERVWQVMSDTDHWHEWTPSITGVKRLGGRPLAVGTRALVRQPKLLPALMRVIEIQPGSHFTWVGVGPGFRVVADHVVEPTVAGRLVGAFLVDEHRHHP